MQRGIVIVRCMEGAMHVSMLGPLGVTVEETRVELGPRLRRLLAALAAAEGRVVSIDRLIEIVWQGEVPRRAESTLRSYVTRLRRTIGIGRDDLIIHRPPGYVLQLEHDELDARLFEHELDRASRCLQLAEVDDANQLLSSAVSRWRGRALEEFADEDWARPAAVRLEERLVEARELGIDILLALGRFDAAVAGAQQLVLDEPLRERPRGALMRALYASGRRAESLRVLGDFRTYLVEETGLDPTDDLRQLERRILDGDADLEPTARPLRGYDLAERIGEGTFAVVHRATQRGLEREVAVKIIRPDVADSPEFIRRFEAEARTIARIEHPNVVPLFDFWREPGAAYLVMRYLRGGTVEQAIRTGGPFSRRRTLALLEQIGPAIEAAHRAGVVHSDIRPANLLLDTDGTVYLADFGIARPATSLGRSPVASPAFAAPEVIRGEQIDVRADVFSLGVTVFEVLTGRLTFDTSTDHDELIRRQLTAPLPPVRGTRTDLPPAVDEVLARATAKAREDRHASVSGFVADLRSALSSSEAGTDTVASLKPAASSIDTPNPYRGLHAFDEDDTEHFHGRDALVTELVEAVERHGLTVVVGPSGSGKSSVVRAGLLPAIRRGAVNGSDLWFVTTMLPGPDPVDRLEAALLRIAVNPPSSLRELLAEDGGLLRAVRRVLPDDRVHVLLVVDQFEELFTQVTGQEQRDRFLTELAAAISAPRSPLRVVATLRADHYDAPLRHPAMAELVTRGTVTVRPLMPDELGQVIVEPARAVGVEVEQALIAELVAGVSNRPAALPLLQYALTEAFDRRITGTMTLDAHRELGGLTGALATRADRILTEGGEADIAEARRIFRRLVTLGEGVEDSRRRALRSELGDDERTAWLLSAFASARLLEFDRDDRSREPTIEIAHEALLRDWPRLRSWLAEDRADLRTLHEIHRSTDAWRRADRDPGDLARGARLATISEFAARRPDWPSDAEASWIDASVEAAEAEWRAEQAAVERDRRQNRRLRWSLAATGLLLVVALVGAGLAVRSQRETARERTENRVRALSLESAAELESGDPDVALRVALAADESAASLGSTARGRVMDEVHNALHASRLVAVGPEWGHGVAALRGDVFVVAGDDQVAVLDDDGREIVRRTLEETVSDVAVSPDGGRVVVMFGDLLATDFGRPAAPATAGVVLDTDDLRTLTTLRGGGTHAFAAWSDSGESIAAPGLGIGPARIWDATTGEPKDLPANIWRLGFLGSDRVLAATAERLEVIDLGEPARATAAIDDPRLPAALDALLVLPDRKHVAVASFAAGEVQIWSLASGELVRTVPHGAPAVLAASVDGRRLAIGGNRTDVLVVELETGELTVLNGNGGAVTAAAFSDTGEYLAVSGRAVGARIYSLRAEGPVALGNRRVDGAVFKAIRADSGDLVVSVVDDRGAHIEVLGTDGTRRIGPRFTAGIFMFPTIDPRGDVVGGFDSEGAGVVIELKSDRVLLQLQRCEFPRAIDRSAGWVVVEPACLFDVVPDAEIAEAKASARRGWISLETGELLASLPDDVAWTNDAVVGPPGSPIDGVLVVTDFEQIVAFDGVGNEVGRWTDLGINPLIMLITDAGVVGTGDQLGGGALLDLSDLAEGELPQPVVLRGLDEGPTHRLLPVGNVRVTSGSGRRIRVWDGDEMLAEVSVDPGVGFSGIVPVSDDEVLYQDADGVLRRLIVDPERLAGLARSRVVRPLTAEECRSFELDCA